MINPHIKLTQKTIRAKTFSTRMSGDIDDMCQDFMKILYYKIKMLNHWDVPKIAALATESSMYVFDKYKIEANKNMEVPVSRLEPLDKKEYLSRYEQRELV